MKRDDRDLLLALLDGTLRDDEEHALRARLARSPELRAELARLEGTRTILRTAVEHTAKRAVKPLLAERVMGRIARGEKVAAEDDGAGYLFRFFRPVLAVGLAVGAALAFYNVSISDQYATHGSVAETVLALPSVSTAAIYDLPDLPTNQADEQ